MIKDVDLKTKLAKEAWNKVPKHHISKVRKTIYKRVGNIIFPVQDILYLQYLESKHETSL